MGNVDVNDISAAINSIYMPPPRSVSAYPRAGFIGKIGAALFLFFTAFSLSALTHPDVTIHVSMVTGNGVGDADNYYLYRQIVSELTGWNYTLAENWHNADYSLNGRIAPYIQNPGQPAPITEYSFQVELYDNKAAVSLVEFGLLYDDLEGIDILITSLLYTILSVIPEDPPPPPGPPAPVVDNIWRNHWWFFGFSGFWTPRIYYGDDSSTHFMNFGFGVSMELHFLPFMSFGLGVELAPEWVTVTSSADDRFRNLMLEFPVYLKLVFKPSSHYMIEPFGGIHFNFPLYETTWSPLVSWLAGIQYGVKAGGGMLFVEPRFSMDLGKSHLNPPPGVITPEFQRYLIHIGFGYKHGAGPKKKYLKE